MIAFDILLRWLHIFPAIALVGGTMYMRLVLFPALEPFSKDERQSLQEAMRFRWAKIVMASVAILLASGLVNYGIAVTRWEFPQKFYHPVLGIKMLLGLVVMYNASLLSGRSERAKRFREKGTFWTTVNLVLALIVVALGGVARVAHRDLKTPETPKVSVVFERPAGAVMPVENDVR